MILYGDPGWDEIPDSGPDGVVLNPTRRWTMRDRFSPEDLQAMIDLYKWGATARQVAEQFGIGLTSMKKVLHEHGVRKSATH